MPFNYYFSHLLISPLFSYHSLLSFRTLWLSSLSLTHGGWPSPLSSLLSFLRLFSSLLSFKPLWFSLLFLFLTHCGWRLPLSSFCCSLAMEEKGCIFVSGFGFGLCLCTKHLGYVWWRTMGFATTTSDESCWRHHHWWLSLLSLFLFLLFIYFSFGFVLCWFGSW